MALFPSFYSSGILHFVCGVCVCMLCVGCVCVWGVCVCVVCVCGVCVCGVCVVCVCVVCVCVLYCIFSIHSSSDGHLGCFRVLSMVNSYAVNIGVHVSI